MASMELKIGQKAPEISLPDQNGEIKNLRSHIGKWILIYFYPKDDTPGCTKEACSLRDNFQGFRGLSAEVIGISKDSVKSHKKFAEKYDLPFTLLSDIEHKTAEDYGVWQEKKFMGRKYMGMNRSSFLIDTKGKIAKIYINVKPEDHADEVMADLKAIL
jgi:peroxiredoxin Q/BCP